MTNQKSEKKINHVKDHKGVEDCYNHPECVFFNEKDTPYKAEVFFEHGGEGTHYACLEIIHRDGGRAKCCGCEGHKCKR